MTLVVLLLACSSAPSPDSTGDDSAGAGDFSAANYPVADVAVAALGTGALRLTFTTELPLQGQAFFDNGDGHARQTVMEESPTTNHDLVLVGVAPGLSFEWRVELTGEAGVVGGTTGTGAGATPAGAPEFTATTLEEGVSEGLTLISAVKDMHPWLLLFDEAGRAVWTVDVGTNQSSVTAPRLARDGRSVLINAQAPSLDTNAKIGRVDFDGTMTSVAEGPGLHIDFAERADGGFVALGWELKQFDDRTLLGDTLLLLDAEGSTGLWSAFDTLPVDLSQTYETGFYVPDPTVEDWSHVNGLSLDPETGDVLATMTVDDGVMRVDGTTGEMKWRLTSDASGTLDAAGETLTDLPHWVQALGDDHYLVFNRGDRQVNPNVCSDVRDIEVDEAKGTASSGWHYASADCAQTQFRGAGIRLQNGNTLIDYSAGGLLQEVSGDGTLLRTLQAPAGWQFGYADHTAALR